jgi:hypothetical protein
MVQITKYALEVGDIMPDGSIFADISPDTGKQMFVTPKDTGIKETFNYAAGFAEDLNRKNYLGHNDWRVPSRAELKVLFNHQWDGALDGTFKLTGTAPLCLYRLPPLSPLDTTSFDVEHHGYEARYHLTSVRCVR